MSESVQLLLCMPWMQLFLPIAGFPCWQPCAGPGRDTRSNWPTDRAIASFSPRSACCLAFLSLSLPPFPGMQKALWTLRWLPAEGWPSFPHMLPHNDKMRVVDYRGSCLASLLAVAEAGVVVYASVASMGGSLMGNGRCGPPEGPGSLWGPPRRCGTRKRQTAG